MREFYYIDTGEIIYAKQVTVKGMQTLLNKNNKETVRAYVGDWVVLDNGEYRIVSAQAFNILFTDGR